MSALVEDHATRQTHWSESIAVGSERFVEGVKEKLGMTATHREVVQAEDSYVLRESVADYAGDFDPEIVPLSTTNRSYWDINVGASDG
jgi:putative transposase